jgi:hypothetical protein
VNWPGQYGYLEPDENPPAFAGRGTWDSRPPVEAWLPVRAQEDGMTPEQQPDLSLNYSDLPEWLRRRDGWDARPSW